MMLFYIINLIVKSAEKIEEIYKEAKILKSIRHKNIIQLHQTFILKNDLCMIMEYADGGELKDEVLNHGGISEC